MIVDDILNGENSSLMSESSQYCAFLVNYIGQYSACIEASAYDAFKADPKNEGKSALVLLSPENFNLLMTEDDDPRFKLLIIPDHTSNPPEILDNRVITEKCKNLKNFVDKVGSMHGTG